jgi:PadR family transcriptional regulator PadR
MSKGNPDVLQGTLGLLILKTLARGPQHGYGITVHVQQVSDDVLRVEEGSLYPALHRIEQTGWISSEWGFF